MGVVVDAVDCAEFSDAAQRFPSVVFFVADVVRTGAQGEVFAQVDVACQIEKRIGFAVLGKRPRVVQIIAAVDGVRRFFSCGAGQVRIEAPAFGRSVVAQIVNGSPRGKGVNWGFLSVGLFGFAFDVADIDTSVRALRQTDAVEVPCAVKFQTFHPCRGAVLVLPNGRADQGGTVGNRSVVGAVGIIGRYAHVGQFDKITVAGLETGEFKVSCFAAAGKSQLEVFGGFCLKVRVCFKVEVRMREQ